MVKSYLLGFICTMLFDIPFVAVQKLMCEEIGKRKMTQGDKYNLYPNNVMDKISLTKEETGNYLYKSKLKL